ncbi:MAG: dTMP kinase [Desulfatirhabdiaceae bacterium]
MFITFEGIEGSGKSTQARLLADWLNQTGHSCLLTREPGGDVIGRRIRSVLLDPESRNMSPVSELLLYLADRVQHIDQVILPAMKDGKTVISDRYADATLVYQGYARGLDRDLIIDLHERLCQNLQPAITFLLDLPVKDGLSRAWKQLNDGTRDLSESRFEAEALDFHERVRNGYRDVARHNPDRFEIINALPDVGEIQSAIRQAFLSHLKENNI